MIFTHPELIITGRPDTLWRVFVVVVVVVAVAVKGAPNKRGGVLVLRSPPSSLPGSPSTGPRSRSVETHCPLSDSVLTADVGDRRVSQGDRMDDRKEGWRNVGGGEGGEAGPADVAGSRATREGIFLPNL